jgi:hypothetical protein
MTSTTDKLELQSIKEQLKNKQKIRLLFPYSENAEVKKLGAKWDNVNKYWYYPALNGDLPEPLKKYKAHKIFIEYDDKEYYKPLLKSMKFDKIEKMWLVNQEDFDTFSNI